VHWDVGLNKKNVAYFFFPKEDNDLRLVAGDELKLKHVGLNWESTGHILKLTSNEEVALEIHAGGPGTPTHVAHGFSIDFLWKATSYDRMQVPSTFFCLNPFYLLFLLLFHDCMQAAMRTFAVDEMSVSGYLYVPSHITSPVALVLSHHVTRCSCPQCLLSRQVSQASWPRRPAPRHQNSSSQSVHRPRAAGTQPQPDACCQERAPKSPVPHPGPSWNRENCDISLHCVPSCHP
jgi:hypothetical protein